MIENGCARTCVHDIQTLLFLASLHYILRLQSMFETSCISQCKNMQNMPACYRPQILRNPLIALFISQINRIMIYDLMEPERVSQTFNLKIFLHMICKISKTGL